MCVDRDDTNECARARFFQDDDDDEKVDNYSIYPHDEDWIFFSLSLSLIHTQSLSFFSAIFFHLFLDHTHTLMIQKKK